jgi:hypothetical protein
MAKTKFYNVTKDEMEALLLPQGFKPMTLPRTVELVYGKIVTHGSHNISMRVYTGINPSGESRGCGQDAIRVQLFIMYEGAPAFVGKAQRVLRIETWATNLQKAIDKWEDNYKVCPACGWPMVIRNGKNGEFWGCVTWVKTKCNGKASGTARPPVVVTEEPDDEDTAPEPVPAPKKSSLWASVMTQTGTADEVDRLAAEMKAARIVVPSAPVPVTSVLAPSSVHRKRTAAAAGATDPMDLCRIPADKISVAQLRAAELFETTQKNLMLPSRAGGGKTALLRHLSTYRKEAQRFAYLAFNRKNANEAKRKMPRGVWSMTTHSYLLSVLREAIRTMPERADDNKTWNIMEEVYPSMGNKDRKRIRRATYKLVGLSKNYAVRPGDVDGIKAVMDRYSFELASEAEVGVVIDNVAEILNLSKPGAKYGVVFDCDDMLWWWVILDLAPKFFHVALLDEVQDFNECQLEMVRRMLDKQMRVVAVGDPYQAVYRFRGADNEAYDKLAGILAGSAAGCETVLLPTNYRCGRKIIEYVRANTIVKDIEAAPDAIEGEVREDLSYDRIIDMLADEFGQPLVTDLVSV